MAFSLYSTRFILRTSATGPQSYPVPAGMLAVVRDMDVTLEPTGGANVLLFIAGALIFIAQFGLEPQFTDVQWRGRAVAYPGELVELDTTDTGSGHVGGYLLTAP